MASPEHTHVPKFVKVSAYSLIVLLYLIQKLIAAARKRLPPWGAINSRLNSLATKMPSTSVCIRFPKEGKGVIATDNSLLRHDGVVYTNPECMKGVPVEKVNRNHPYWEKCWPDLQIMVKQTQQFWTDRYNALLDREMRAGGGSASPRPMPEIFRETREASVHLAGFRRKRAEPIFLDRNPQAAL